MISARQTAALLAAAGLGASLYLSAVELARGQVPLACVNSGIINCDLVTASPQSRVGPVPIAVLGALWFLVLLALLAMEGRVGVRAAAAMQLGWTTAGLLVVFYLVYAELFLIGALCLWCTVVHVLVVLLFLLVLARVAGASA